MKYFDYAIKYIIRRLLRMILKPKILLVLLFIMFIFLLFTNSSKAATTSYGSVYDYYDSVNTDLVTRIKNATGASTEGLLSILKNNNYGYYCYYGEQDGTSQNTAYFSNSEDLWVVVYPITSVYHPDASDTSYHGFVVQNLLLKDYEKFYHFDKNNLSVELGGVSSVIMPQPFFGYRSSILYDFLNSDSRDETDDIVSSIEKQTNTINQQTTVIEEGTNKINDSINKKDINESSGDIEGSYSEVSSSVSDYSNVADNLIGFYIQLNEIFVDRIQDIVEDSVYEISLPVPFTDDFIVLKSDMVSRHIEGTFLYSFIQLCYVVCFSFYIINTVLNMADWLSSGEFINGRFFSHKNIISEVLN